MPIEDEIVYGFNKEQATELVGSLGQRDFRAPLHDGLLGGDRIGYLVHTGSGVTARSGTTAGSGTVTICTLSSGTITTTSTTITAYNIAEVAVPGSCYAITRSIGGQQVIDPPSVTDLQVSTTALQLRRNCGWTTWHTGEDCTT